MKPNTNRQNVANAFQNLFPTTPGERELTGALRLVKRELIAPTKQPRTLFPAEELQSLADNIREGREAGLGVGGTGILQPLLVRAALDNGEKGTTYTLIAGERRWRASQMAGCAEVPVLVVSADEHSAWEMALVENIQRQALSPVDEGEAIHHFMGLQGLSIREAAKKLGKDRGYLENRLALCRARPDVQAMVTQRPDSLMQAKLIEKVQDESLRAQLIRATLEESAPITAIQKRIETAQNTKGLSLHNDKPSTQQSQRKQENDKKGLLQGALKPANDLLALALSELKKETISNSQKRAAQRELATLKTHIAELEAALDER